MQTPALGNVQRNVGLDVEALSLWALGVGAVQPPLRASVLSAGRSNLTYAIEDATGSRFVLRRPPAGPVPKGAHDVLRECEILTRLAGTAVPVPEIIASCADEKVIGAPFFLMRHVDGLAVTDPATASALSPEGRARVGPEMVRALASLHHLDPAAVGLGSLVRAEGFVERQLRTWTRQLDALGVPDAHMARQVGRSLGQAVSPSDRTSILHGDFKLANMIVSPAGDLRGLLDWELASTGDPLVDVGWLLAWWVEPSDGRRWITAPPTTVPGFSAPADLLSEYAALTGLDLHQVGFYVAFAYWRLSCINLATRHRFTAGQMDNRVIDLAALDEQVEWQLAAARQLLKKTETTSGPARD